MVLREKPVKGEKFRPSASQFASLLTLLDEKDRNQGAGYIDGNATSVVKVKNETGAKLGRFNIVTLGALTITEATSLEKFLGNVVYKGAKPVTADYSRDKRIAITESSMSETGIGRAIASGITPCKVNITSTLHKYARPTNDDCTKLTSDWWGQCRILAQETGTGDKMALVQVGNYFDHSYVGKFVSEVGDEDTGTLTVWSGIGAGATATTGTIEEVYNRYAELLEADKFARVSWDNDGPECVAIRCA